MGSSMAQDSAEMFGWDSEREIEFYTHGGQPEYHYNNNENKEEDCPRCKTGYLKLRKGRYGLFWGCSNYPNCKYTKNYTPFKLEDYINIEYFQNKN